MTLDDLHWRHEFRPGDLGRIAALHGEVYAREFGWPAPWFEADVADILSAFARSRPERGERDRLWLAETPDGQFAGSVFAEGRSAEWAHLRCLIVAPGSRGLGLGRRLTEEVVNWSRARGHGGVRFFTTSGQMAALRVYRACGFVKTGEERHKRWGVPVVQEWYELKL